MSLDALYQEVILDHYKNPYNYGTLPGAPLVHQENPSCGDQIDLQLIVGADQHIQAIKFTGQGCAISRASASMMTQVVEGKTVEEARRLIAEFQQMLINDADVPDELGDLEALRGVRQFPVRIKCATLAWHALQILLNAHILDNQAKST
ncbi:MAG: Fe-S cluster assembly sulfur transfer protein SufU [Aggregatilineales bacterium]